MVIGAQAHPATEERRGIGEPPGEPLLVQARAGGHQQRVRLVGIRLAITRANETVVLYHQAHIDNVP